MAHDTDFKKPSALPPVAAPAGSGASVLDQCPAPKVSIIPSVPPDPFLYPPTATHDPTEGQSTEKKVASGFVGSAFAGRGASVADHDPPE